MAANQCAAIDSSSKAIQIDTSSQVFNGDVTNSNGTGEERTHRIQGGSVRNNSKLFNGNMDPESFIAFFCRDR